MITSTGKKITMRNVVKKFDDFYAVNGIDLTIEKGEFFTLLGPSGCGKTTLLRMIAGFHALDRGEILFDTMVINDVPTHKRNIGMVFQHYAIFPHLSVFDNVAYGLKARNVKKESIKQRVTESLRLVEMDHLSNRTPAQLCGGQRQRVALARAIVIEPDVLLMDEPLSNLDAKLRIAMRNIIKKVQKDLNITTLYVTHDQEEALSLSDRIAVMKQGRISQIGEPYHIYRNPVNSFTANFIGISNFCEGTVINTDSDGMATIFILGFCFQIKLSKRFNGKVLISIRPEDIVLNDSQVESIRGRVRMRMFLGDFITSEILLSDGQILQVKEYTKDLPRSRKVGEEVGVRLHASMITVYNETGEEVLSERAL